MPQDITKTAQIITWIPLNFFKDNHNFKRIKLYEDSKSISTLEASYFNSETKTKKEGFLACAELF